MDLMTLLQAAFLGLVEGLTEFLPVSSTGHLILLVDLLGFEGPPGALFEIVIQLGAILAVCWVYREKLATVTIGLFAGDTGSWRFALNILIAFLPAMVIGVFAYDFIKGVLFSPWVVSVMLIVGGIAILVIERLLSSSRFHKIEDVPLARALGVGLFQCLAMIPGVSRSGATIMGALIVGFDRPTAATFSFFISIPTMLAATSYDLFKNWSTLSTDGALVIAVGFIMAFVTALLVVRTAIAFIAANGFAPFAYYRMVIGVIMLIILMNS